MRPPIAVLVTLLIAAASHAARVPLRARQIDVTRTTVAPPATSSEATRETPTSTSTTTTAAAVATGLVTLPGIANATSQGNVSALIQAYAFRAPNEQDATDPTAGRFGIFASFGPLTPDQELRLTNRSWYFKAAAGVRNVNAQATLGATATPSLFRADPDPNVSDVPVPTERPVPTAAPASSPYPPQAVSTPTDVPFNGAIDLVNNFTGLPQSYLPATIARNRSPDVALWPTAMDLTNRNTNNTTVASDQSYLVLPPLLNASGNASTSVVPQFAVLSDIDDTIKVTNVSSPMMGLFNTFCEEYVPIPGVPALFGNWSATRGGFVSANNSGPLPANAPVVMFSYITGTPLPLATGLLQFLNAYYPPGSLTLRPTTDFDPQSFWKLIKESPGDAFRSDSITRVLNTFAAARAVVVADTTKRAWRAYVNVVEAFGDRVACIYLRNLTEAESGGNRRSVALKRKDAVKDLSAALDSAGADPSRADRMLVSFSDPATVTGYNWTTGQC